MLVVTPADQTIAKPAAFTAAMRQAIAQAEQGNIVILGVTPDKPETGYGYIRAEKNQSLPLHANTVCRGLQHLLVTADDHQDCRDD